MGALALRDSFFVIDPTSTLSVSSSPRGELAPGDGSLSYKAFSDRLIILDVSHHRLQVSEVQNRSVACANCAHLVNVLQELGGSVLVTDGFAVNGQRTTAIIDPLYTGAILALGPIRKVVGFEKGPANGSYREDTLLFVRPVSVTFGNRTLSKSAPLVRADRAYDASGRHYDAVIGLSLLSKSAFAFDFHNMKIWLSNSTGAPVLTSDLKSSR